MRHRPRKRFGQHFLADSAVAAEILAAVRPRPGETIVEIGPGEGVITAGLCASGATLHAIEFDRDLVPALKRRFAGRSEVVIHEADALDFDYGSIGTPLRVVGNLPYNISTPLLFRLLDTEAAILDAHFMLQKEVVDRITAQPGSKSYGRLTIMLRRRMHAERLFDVPPSAFRPLPRVTSSFVRLWPRPGTDIPVADEKLFARLVAQGFSQRRKTLRNALRGAATEDELHETGISPGSRAEEVAVEAWAALANLLANRDRMEPAT